MNTMQLAQHAARAQGMGLDFGGSVFGSGGGGGGFNPSGGGGFDWSRLIEPISNFGQTFLQAKYAKDAAKHAGGYYPTGQQGAPQYTTQQAGGLTAEQQAALLAAQQQATYGSGAITERGIQIGSTVISWPILGLGVGMLFLLQSPGFSRRR